MGHQAANRCSELLAVDLTIELEIGGGDYEVQQLLYVVYREIGPVLQSPSLGKTFSYDVERLFDGGVG